jgi:hypothetical protein
MSNSQTPAISPSQSSSKASASGFQRQSSGVRNLDASADLAFFQLFQQLGKQPGLSAGHPAPLFSTPEEAAQPSLLVDSPDHNDTSSSPETLKATVSKVVATSGDDLPPLKLDKPLSKQDGDFLEWLVNQQTPVNVQLNGLPVNIHMPAWLAGQAMSQGGGGNRAVSGQLSEQMVALVKEATRTGRAIRVPLQNSVEVILKIRHGQVSAEFLTPDASPSLQQTVAELRQHLASKSLPVGTIGVREHTPQDNPNQREQEASDDDNND